MFGCDFVWLRSGSRSRPRKERRLAVVAPACCAALSFPQVAAAQRIPRATWWAAGPGLGGSSPTRKGEAAFPPGRPPAAFSFFAGVKDANAWTQTKSSRAIGKRSPIDARRVTSARGGGGGESRRLGEFDRERTDCHRVIRDAVLAAIVVSRLRVQTHLGDNDAAAALRGRGDGGGRGHHRHGRGSGKEKRFRSLGLMNTLGM